MYAGLTPRERVPKFMDNRVYARQLGYLTEKVKQKQRPLVKGVNKPVQREERSRSLILRL